MIFLEYDYDWDREEEFKRLWDQRMKEIQEKDMERNRARSAVMNNVKKNEIQRRKMNEMRLMQAKMKRDEEKLRMKDNIKA